MTKNFPELGLRKEDCVEGSWIDFVLCWANFDNTTGDNYIEVDAYRPEIGVKCMLEGGWLVISVALKICDALTGDELHSLDHKHIVRACSFSEDTHLLLTGGFEKILRIFDLNCPDAPPREVEKSSPGSVRTVAWLHSDQTILSSCSDSGGVSKDGRYITTADGSSVKFWDANHFGLVKSYDMPCTVESASLEPKFGNKFIAGGEDMWIRLFDFNTGEEIAIYKGHHGPVHSIRFSQGGESYVSDSEDGTVRI
ncbi:unnamed protein product [Lactuca virosa]|uniref:Serine-threonine kinase receptor-associated protein n=1 Tax=Lactuca virosa TaxID=75947 RepID=A0AAU9PKZ8_9ASTR|nr:unnamed protein product [Lactuca virosa]